MRTFKISLTPLASALALAVLTAACDDLPAIPMTARPDHTSRYTVTKDLQGRQVRFDAVTGEVTSVNGGKVWTTAPLAAARVAPRAAPAAVVEAPLPTPVVVPVRTIKAPTAVILPPAPALTPLTFDELCGQHDERVAVAVTRVDTGVYARPSIGTRMVGRVVGGTLATIAGGTDDWLRVSLDSPKGPLSGFVHCSTLRPLNQESSE